MNKVAERLRKCYAHGRTFPECAEGANEIERLEAKIEELEQELDNIKCVEFPKRLDKVNNTWRQRAEKAEAESAAPKENAARYQYIKKNATIGWSDRRESHYEVMVCFVSPHKEQVFLDELIDTVMEK